MIEKGCDLLGNGGMLNICLFGGKGKEGVDQMYIYYD